MGVCCQKSSDSMFFFFFFMGFSCDTNRIPVELSQKCLFLVGPSEPGSSPGGLVIKFGWNGVTLDFPKNQRCKETTIMARGSFIFLWEFHDG